MSLQKGLEQTESHLIKTSHGIKRKSSKWYKLFRNRWLRRFNKLEKPNTKIRKGWEY